jgi:hypothetical protein
MLTFLNATLGTEIKSLRLQGDKAIIETKTMNVNEVLAQTIESAAKRLEEYTKDRKVDIPLTGNEKKIFKTLQKTLGLPEGSTFVEALKSYAQILRSYNPPKLTAAFSKFGAGDFIPISILKPDFYTLTRAPFMKGKERYEVKLNLDYFMILIAGYIFSRLGSAPYDIQRGKRTYQTVHLLPYEIGSIYSELYAVVGLEKEEGTPTILPGLRPEEAVILWLSLILPEKTPDLFLLSINDPAGPAPASIGVAYHLPVSSFMTRAGEKLQKIKADEKLKGYLKDLLRNALNPVRPEKLKIRERAIEIAKLLFLALQKGNEKERDELLLRASRIETSMLLGGRAEEDERWIVYKGRRLAEAIST